MKPTFLLSTILLSAAGAAFADIQTFEGDGFGAWQTEGKAFGLSPVHEKLDGLEKPFTNFANDAFALSAHGGNDAVGTLTSPEIKIDSDYLMFLVAGGDTPAKLAVQLIIDGNVVMEATGKKSQNFSNVVWDIKKFKGKNAVIRIVDDAKGEWGYIAVDHFMQENYANSKFPPSTKKGKPYAEGLVTSPVLAGAMIPKDSTLVIDATFKNEGIKSPTALTFDEKGNVYVAETHRFRHGIEDDRNHLYWYLDDLQAMKVEDRRALHKKWEKKLSNKYMTEVTEVIRKLSDTNGDGKIDQSNVFADNFNDVVDGTAAGIFYYDGAIYFACIPKIYKMLDENGDGKSDKNEVVQDGFGVRISLSGHDLNGFTLGPDGMIYGTVGDRGYSFTTKEGKTYHYPNEGALFRFEPDGSGFEIVHTGLRNPKEIAFDEFGNAFTVDNNSDQGDAARILYLVEGGETGWQMEHQTMHTFHRQIGLETRPLSRWMNEKMWEMRNETQPAYILPPSALLTSGPSGLTYHPGAGFLKSEKGRFLICDYRGGAATSGIWSFEMKPDGAGMKMTDARKFQWGVAATDVEYSFDGRVFITDFVTGWQSHNDGRLLSLNAGENLYLPDETREAAKLIAEGFDQRSSAELEKWLGHADSRVRLRAQVALTRKPDAIASFQKAINSNDLITRIHGIWGMGIIARRGVTPSPKGEFTKVSNLPSLREKAAAALTPLLKDSSPDIRVQALRVIRYAPVKPETLSLTALLKDDSAAVRFEAAITIGKMKSNSHFNDVLEFIKTNDNRDVYLRHAGIYALEHIASSPSQVGDLVKSNSPAIRLAAVVALRRMKSDELKRFINDTDPYIQDEVIRAIDDLDMVDLKPLCAALLDKASARKWTPLMLRRLVNHAYRVGSAENADRIFNIISDKEIPEVVKTEALRLLAIWEKPNPVDPLSGKWRPLAPRSLDTLKPSLVKAIPKLLSANEQALSGALDLSMTYKLGADSISSDKLRDYLFNDKLLPGTRSKALAVYISRKEKDLLSVLEKLAEDPMDEVAVSAMKGMANVSPKEAIAALEKAIASGDVIRTQKAWPILAVIPDAEAGKYIITHLTKLQAAEGISPSAVELLAAAKSRKEAEVKKALTDFDTYFTEKSDTYAKYNIALEGGDPVKGFSLFKSLPAGQCMRCHKASDKNNAEGGEAGPNLAGAGKLHDRKYLLQSLVNPSAVVAPGFGITAVTFKNSANLVGNLVEETPDNITVSTPVNTWSIKRADIASFTPPVSAMPPMAGVLKPEELRDLVAWLASLETKTNAQKPLKVETLDPATLLKAK
ncbi:MAG: HEAT repeat domain-containing protein [Akkermansiaceae bacterium]